MGRKRRLNKDKTMYEKETKTLNFDVPVLRALEERARKTGKSESYLINALARRHFLGDVEFYTELEKQMLADLTIIQYNKKMAVYDRQRIQEERNETARAEMEEMRRKEAELLCQTS